MRLERAGEGSAPDRVEDLYVRYAPGALRLAYLLLGDPDLAEDCVQDAFVRVVGRLGHLRDASAFDAYLRRTIVNQTKNHWRRRSTERAHAERSGPPLPVASPDRAIAHRLEVWQALQLLPPRQRTALVLRYYEDLPESEVAAVLRCRPGTARSLISRGKASLRSTLERYDDG